jgi:hypothetical protein
MTPKELDKFIDRLCFSYQHDFGILPEREKEIIRIDCVRWLSSLMDNTEDIIK